MLLNRKSVELLAPVGKWETLTAAINAGADAVYLGGKAFNMRMFKNDFNFDNESLVKAADYVHKNNANLYITLNNLISDDEVANLKEFLCYLNEKVRPDALIVQDFAVIKLIKELNLDLNIHSSIMMNTHNVEMIKKFKELGITRVVASREMSLDQIKLLREMTGMEIEYFIHGDMCIAEGGQCFHSGVVFGNSSNRGRCMKSCRWQYRFIEEELAKEEKALLEKQVSYKLALDDMCMYRHLPELIQSGVYSFKIEGRMRDADFISKIVSLYREAIDRYIKDPAGYSIDEDKWQQLMDNRARDFSSCFAIDKPSYKDIGLSGEREPKFFSMAIKEADLSDAKLVEDDEKITNKPKLSVRCATLKQAEIALKSGANIIYVGGDIYLPQKPWTLEMIKEAKEMALDYKASVFVNTPRITRFRAISEMEQLFNSLENEIRPDGILVHNIGTLNLAKKTTTLPIRCGYSFNIYNHKAAELLQDQGAVSVVASVEMPHHQVKTFLNECKLPVEIIVHGSIEAMICDFDYIEEETGKKQEQSPEAFEKHYALVDMKNEIHPIRRNQYGRNHILFTHDLCLLPYLDTLKKADSFLIEVQDYNEIYTKEVIAVYRQVLDGKMNVKDGIDKLQSSSPRPLGCGVYRYTQTK